MKTINEVYAGMTFQEIEAGLKIVGGLSEQSRLSGKSLEFHDRLMFLRIREAARRLNLSRQMQNAIENEGAEAVRQAVRS